MRFLKNCRGYTFVEAIFQLIIIVLFAHVMLFILLWFAQFQNIEAMQAELNWELFVIDVRDYLKEARQFNVINDGRAIRFQVVADGDLRSFIVEKSTTDHIRKRAPAGGNEIMLPYVKEINFAVISHELHMTLQMIDGQKRERIFIVPMDE
ncbi:MAG: competence type IV pilus minor pilin ComGF [Solibacillus sp.]